MARQISLSQGFHAIVDDDNYEWLNQWKWSAMAIKRTRNAYAVRKVGQAKGETKQNILMHRVILNAPEGAEVDHTNGNTLDNQRHNLRLVTRAENLRNRRTFKNSQSGYKGVTYNPKNGKWKVTINLGTFDSSEEAARAYDEAIKRLFGSLAKPNFDF